LQRKFAGPKEDEPFSGGDAFAAKLDPDGSINYATYLGGSDEDTVLAIEVDLSGNLYTFGYTQSRDLTWRLSYRQRRRWASLRHKKSTRAVALSFIQHTLGGKAMALNASGSVTFIGTMLTLPLRPRHRVGPCASGCARFCRSIRLAARWRS
jgi:hypothetical protein